MLLCEDVVSCLSVFAQTYSPLTFPDRNSPVLHKVGIFGEFTSCFVVGRFGKITTKKKKNLAVLRKIKHCNQAEMQKTRVRQQSPSEKIAELPDVDRVEVPVQVDA